MAARSRRSSTMASSLATEDLARQRTEMHTEASRHASGTTRLASRPKRGEREPKPKRQRRPRRWAPPGWDGNRWSARSIHPGGLETHHEPCMSSFISGKVPSSPTDTTRSTGRLAWLRPRNSVSIWEHFADVKRTASTASVCGAMAADNGSSPASVSVMGNGAPTTETLDRSIAAGAVGAIAGSRRPAPLGSAVSDSGQQLPSFLEASAAVKTSVWLAPTALMLAAATNPRKSATSCATSSSVVGGIGDLDVLAPRTPAVTCPADRVSIMALVNGT